MKVAEGELFGRYIADTIIDRGIFDINFFVIEPMGMTEEEIEQGFAYLERTGLIKITESGVKQ